MANTHSFCRKIKTKITKFGLLVSDYQFFFVHINKVGIHSTFTYTQTTNKQQQQNDSIYRNEMNMNENDKECTTFSKPFSTKQTNAARKVSC